jgi:hypothetical protein
MAEIWMGRTLRVCIIILPSAFNSATKIWTRKYLENTESLAVEIT